jgi:branched-chain amino acid transport system substrate-binding protein
MKSSFFAVEGKNMSRRLCVAALLAASLSASVYNFKAFGAVDSAKVGVILPMTGQTASFGMESLNGMKLALEKDSAKPSLNLVVEDSQGNNSASVNAANKLISTDKVNVILGEVTSSNTIAISQIAQNSKVPLLSPAATNDTVTVGKDFVSRICFVDSFQGEVMAKFAGNSLKAKTAVIFMDTDSDYSRGLKASFEKAFVAGGGKILNTLSYSQKDADFKTIILKARKEKPDVVFVPGYYTQVGAILRQSNELKLSVPFLGTDGWDSPELFKLAGKASAGHYVSSHFAADDKDPKVQAFVSDYKAKHKENPGAMAALGYDAALIMKDVLRRAGSTDALKIRDAIAATKDFSGVTGNISIDGNRNARKSAVILKTTETAAVFFERVSP